MVQLALGRVPWRGVRASRDQRGAGRARSREPGAGRIRSRASSVRTRARWRPETVEAIRRFLNPRDAALVSVLAYEGLRPGEAFALEWRDVLDHAERPRERLLIQRALSDHRLSLTKSTGRASQSSLFRSQRSSLSSTAPERRNRVHSSSPMRAVATCAARTGANGSGFPRFAAPIHAVRARLPGARMAMPAPRARGLA